MSASDVQEVLRRLDAALAACGQPFHGGGHLW